MLFAERFWAGLVDGSITMTVRAWKRPQATAGRTTRTPAGLLAIDSVESIVWSDVSEADARRSGFETVVAMHTQLGRPDAAAPLFRVAFHYAGPNPPHGPTVAHDDAELDRRLAGLDRRARGGPWTAATMAIIAERPGVRAGDLAEALGRERLPFKADVRKLKALGLTESLETGYRLSPRGEAYRTTKVTRST